MRASDWTVVCTLSAEINLQLLATIPVIGLLYGAVWGLRRLFGRSRRREKVRTRMGRKFREAETLLIQTYTRDHLDDGELGRLLLMLHALDSDARFALSPAEYEAFTEDLDRLRSFELTNDQKMLIVHRLYRSNPFMQTQH